MKQTPEEKGAVVDITQQGSIDNQAATWVARLDSEQHNADTLAAFREWINQAPEHRKAFEDYVDVWDQLNILTEMLPPGKRTVHKPRWFFVPFATPAALACTTMVLAVSVLLYSLVAGPGIQHYQTTIGEQASFTLPDGSTALLNTDSKITVHYSDQQRRIELDYGEAHFEVEKDQQRPFEVYAGQGLVRAVGTAFSVYLRQDDVEVVVTEGVIEIDTVPIAEPTTSPAATNLPPTTAAPKVAAGNQAIYDRHTAKHILLAEMQKLENRVAWHQGLLVFEDEPLANVVEEVGRYTKTKIIIPEQEVRRLKVGGQFKVGDTRAMFEALSISFNIKTEVVSEDLVYLVRENQSQTTEKSYKK